MNFVYKCLLQQFFSKIPYGEHLNYLFQRRITNSLPASDEKFLRKVNDAFTHYGKFKEFNELKNNGNKYYEFGAGWDLIIPISISLLGFEVTCIDIKYLATPELIQNSLGQFVKLRNKLPFEFDKINSISLNKDKCMETLGKEYNIKYKAPLDARDTGFKQETIDFISSSVTFEHIPGRELLLILNECYRLLKRGGILSLTIDYKDHWSYFDKNISIYNFLRYSEKEWKRYNPSLHYQNRLRHSDYLKIIQQTCFELVEDAPILPTEEDIKVLKQIPLNNDFSLKTYDLHDLGIKGSHIVLRK
ncbi:methyltransferase domain-containing protein [Chitinophaga japonensis]|uniref:Methyltransferase family protein n=1 Tax=Chitinophaga japonensis TaxID=104662 RepID=A0A562TEW9_CHIJA|nr:methyltransferase domain-containing protein [Chitinophaga japonensis]TWI92062.1 methyltransferase family protein [Chitinophaga japonensis]